MQTCLVPTDVDPTYLSGLGEIDKNLYYINPD